MSIMSDRSTHQQQDAPALMGALNPDASGKLGPFLAALLRARDVETAWQLTCEHMAALGFDGVIYGYSPTSTDENIGLQEELLLLSTLDRRAMRVFVDNRLYWESITFNWALRNSGIASWSMTAKEAGLSDSFRCSDAALAFFDKAGMMVGCTIGFPTLRKRGRGVMSLLAPPGESQAACDERCAALGDDLFVAAASAHRTLVDMPFVDRTLRLTGRQREVLEWVADGKSVAEIAAILNISTATVEKHLRLARETLGAESTAHAVTKASFLNQLFLGSGC